MDFVHTNKVACTATATIAGVGIAYYLLPKSKPVSAFTSNPFAHDVARPPPEGKEYPKDKKKVLKNPLSAAKPGDIPESVDVVCIGSGVGSLCTAVMLAKTGRKVLVLEQHSKLGGCCHTFKEGRFEFDTGVHYLGNLHGTGETYRILEQVTEGQIQWAQMDPSYDEVVIGNDADSMKVYQIYGRYANWKRALKSYFPDEGPAIDKAANLFRGNKRATMAIGLFKLLPTWMAKTLSYCSFFKIISSYNYGVRNTSQQVIESLTSNKDLQACLLYCWGDMGAIPAESPFFLTAVVNNHYIGNGGFYPKNGPAMIPYYISKALMNNGGKIYTKALVEEILVRQNSSGKLEAYGVRVKNGKNDFIIKANTVVSGAGIRNTFARLVSEEYRPSLTTGKWLLDNSKPSLSYLNMFIGLSDTAANLNLPSRNSWMYSGNDFNDFFNKWVSEDDPSVALEKYGMPLLFVGFPSAKDPFHDFNTKPGTTCVAITICPYQWFEMWEDKQLKKRGDQYESLKEAISNKMWERILHRFPQLEDKKELAVLGSPVTSNYYLNTTLGEMYGLDHGKQRFTSDFTIRSRPETDVKNLYLTGQDVVTAGVSSAISSSLLTCSSILGENVFLQLSNLYNSIKQQ